jgi:hypothetical protein
VEHHDDLDTVAECERGANGWQVVFHIEPA